MLLDLIFFIALIVVVIIQALFTLIPIGNEKSTVRRLPWITFSIMAICVVVYYVTLPSTVDQDMKLTKSRDRIVEFLEQNEYLLADKKVRDKLEQAGIFSKLDMDVYEKELDQDPEKASKYRLWLGSAAADEMRKEFDEKLQGFTDATEAHLYYKYGLAPNGAWKAHQLITAMFLHGSTMHLFGNLIFFFAVGFSLEDLWGRNTFLVFYLLGGIAACLPSLISPGPLPMVGASGAISATMGAFLIRLHNTKVKIAWLTIPLAVPFMLFGRKPFGVINVQAYIFLPFYFICQVLPWWFFSKAGLVSGVAYSAHIGGFVFGVIFALVMKGSRAEERYINPKIEAKVSFQTSPDVVRALEFLDQGEIELAERKLKIHLHKNPDHLDAILALIQVYQRTLDIEQLNKMYTRLIQHHLANNDREAALYAYDNLLSAFPDDKVEPDIPIRDWITICEYLVEAEMAREAAVEYERIVSAHPKDLMTARACVQGGEAALTVFDNERALRLFEKAQALKAQGGLKARMESGLDKCKLRLEHRPNWVKEAPKPQSLPKDMEEQKMSF